MVRLKVILKRLIRFWELYVAWFFVSPRKQAAWRRKLRKKYKKNLK